MMEAILSLKIPEGWMAEVSQKYPAAIIKILEQKPYAKYGVQDLIEINAPQELMNKIIEDIKKNPQVHKIDITITESGKAVGAISTYKCMACRALASSDCFLISASPTKDGKVQWTLVFSEKDSLSQLIKKLEKVHHDAKLVKLSSINDKEILTSRQGEIIRIAFEKGYFDYPKKITIRELAKMFNISISTLSEILRKGQRKIMMAYLEK